jgi:hypothetical protein
MNHSLFLRVFLLGVAIQCMAQGPKTSFPPTSAHRKEIEEVLRTGKDGPNVSFNEDAISEASRWYEKGDTTILPALLTASRYSDGASSEALGMFLGEQLLKHPRNLLLSASGMPPEIQKEAAMLAVSADGAGWSPKQMKRIRAVLNEYSKPQYKALAPSAKLWLTQLDLFETSNRE